MKPPAEFIDDLRLLKPPRSWWPELCVFVTVMLLIAAAWWFIHRRRANAAGQIAAADAEHAPEDALGELKKLFALICLLYTSDAADE